VVLTSKFRPLIQQRVEPYVSPHVEHFINCVVRPGEQRLMVALEPDGVRALIDEAEFSATDPPGCRNSQALRTA
jgi:hypothetical protein